MSPIPQPPTEIPADDTTVISREVHPQHRLTYAVDGDLRVPVTAIALAPSPDGSTNADVHVYRTSGPGSDPAVGLPPMRAAWIAARGDTTAYAGRRRRLEDDGRTGRHLAASAGVEAERASIRAHRVPPTEPS